jgi:biopolymer transport protein ExbB
MKLLTTILVILALSVTSLAGQPDASDTVSKLSVSAEEELARSSEELSRLNEEIEAEKVPLMKELNALEDKLLEMRRRYEEVSRNADSGALEMTGIKVRITARRDELTYVANLLDEYARSFDSKVNISELQYCGQAMEAAKEATENTTLSMPEKFTRQTGFVDVSMKRLFSAIDGLRFPGTAVDLKGMVAEGQFAIIGPVAMFSSNDGRTAGLAIAQPGSPKPLIRPLEGPLQAGIAPLVSKGEGVLPLDPTRGGALKALVQKTSIVHIFKKGGPIMWPLLVAASLSVLTVLERILFLLNERRKRSPRTVERLFAAVERKDMADAIRIGEASKYYIARTLSYALSHREKSLANALLFAQEKELKRFRRGIPVLDTVITLAPLLGLLGTVTGMMGSFSLIGGELSAPGAITGGIAEALIATAFGLTIAITSLIPFNILNSRMEEARHEIESAAKKLELLVHPENGSLPAGSHAANPALTLHPRQDDFTAQQEIQRRKREALREQMAELKSKIDDQVREMEHLANEERGLRGVLLRDLPRED